MEVVIPEITTAGTNVRSDDQTTPSYLFPFCEPLNSSICNDVLPYNLTFFPNPLTSYANATDLMASAMRQRLQDCRFSATFTMCYFLFPPCIATEFPICRQDCMDGLDDCEELNSVLYDFFNRKHVATLRDTCLEMPEEGCFETPTLPTPPDDNGKCKKQTEIKGE